MVGATGVSCFARKDGRSRRGSPQVSCNVFFFNDTATTEIYTLSLHDALPICRRAATRPIRRATGRSCRRNRTSRSEEHTSELQSRVDISYAVFCLKKKKD